MKLFVPISITLLIIIILLILLGILLRRDKFINKIQHTKLFKINNYHIYVINLKRSTERKNNMIKQLENCPIPWTIIEAIDGTKKLPSDSIPIKPIRPMKPGEIGCFLSHIKVWKTFLANVDTTIAIIMEDDCILPDKWWNSICSVCDKYMPNICNYIHLHKILYKFYMTIGNDVIDYFPEKNNKHLRDVEIDYSDIIITGPQLGMSCYAIDKKAALKLLTSIKTIITAIDVQIHFPTIRKQFQWGKLKKNQIEHNLYKSTIS